MPGMSGVVVEEKQPSRPWYKKFLGLLGAVAGAAAAPFTAGGSAVLGGILAGVGTAAGTAGALSPDKKGSEGVMLPTYSSGGESTITPIGVTAEQPKRSVLDTSTIALNAVESAGNIGMNIANRRMIKENPLPAMGGTNTQPTALNSAGLNRPGMKKRFLADGLAELSKPEYSAMEEERKRIEEALRYS